MPVIGSSFDALANQQANWAGFNTRIQEANLQRAAEAERAQNAWNLAANEGVRRDQLVQNQIEQQAQARAAFSADAREKQRQFDIGADISRQDIAGKRADFMAGIAEKNRIEQEQKDAVAAYAKVKGQDVGDTGDALASAQMEAQKAYADLAVAARDAEIPGKVKFDFRTGGLVSPNNVLLSDKEKAAIAAANQSLAPLYTGYVASKEKYDTLNKSFEEMKQEAERRWGVTFSKQGDKWGIWNPHDKTWYGPKEKTTPLNPAFMSPTGMQFAGGGGGGWTEPPGRPGVPVNNTPAPVAPPAPPAGPVAPAGFSVYNQPNLIPPWLEQAAQLMPGASGGMEKIRRMMELPGGPGTAGTTEIAMDANPMRADEAAVMGFAGRPITRTEAEAGRLARDIRLGRLPPGTKRPAIVPAFSGAPGVGKIYLPLHIYNGRMFLGGNPLDDASWQDVAR